MKNDLYLAIKAHLDAGNSCIPVNWRTKAALAGWRRYMERAPTADEWRAWAKERKPEAYGVICGFGGREVIDIDDNSDVDPEYSAAAFFEPWQAEVCDLLRAYHLPILRTGGGGFQVGYRTEQPSGSLKLAWVPAPSEKSGRKIAIETRGMGGYHIGECSKHPSGKFYRLLEGDLVNPPWITPEERERLLAAARALCLAPESRQTAQARAREYRQSAQRAADISSDGGSVIDAYNAHYTIDELLTRHGYAPLGANYVRPGGNSDSVKVDRAVNVSFHWSSNDVLHRTNGAGNPLPIDPFDVFTVYEHDGDLHAAVRAAAELLGMAFAYRAKSAQTSRNGADSAAHTEEDAAPSNAPEEEAQGEAAEGPAKPRLSDAIESMLTDSWGYYFAENELTGEISFDDTHEILPLDDATRAQLRMKGRDAGLGSKGKPSLGALSDMILILARRNRQHPIRDCLERLVWDGNRHLVALCSHFRGTLPPIDYGNDIVRPVFNVWFYHWLLGAVARAYQGGEVQNPMLALQGGQGIGKSFFGGWLASPFGSGYFVESSIDPHSNEHLRYLAGKFIWQVAEVDSTTRRADRQALKEFMTMQSVTVRRPYDRDPTTRTALANFLGTLNNENGFLSDPTGNRRFLVAEVESIDWAYATTIDPAQLWAEMVHHYKSGAQAALTPVEAARRDKINEEYMVPTNEEEAIQKYYAIDPTQTTWVEYTVDIAEDLTAKGFRTNVTAVGLALRKLMGRPTKREEINGRRGMCARGIQRK